MTDADRIADDAWRLDPQSAAPPPAPAPPLAPPTSALDANLSHLRLARPMYVVTAEHLAWYSIAAWTLLTRMTVLGARPLDPPQGSDALAAFLVAAHGRLAFALADASWVTILQGSIFNALGVTDASSRIVVMLSALLLVATPFAMRSILGRAGALALAALLALSPAITYFSRDGSTAIVSLAFMLIAIAIADSMRRRPTLARAAALGLAVALSLTADPLGYLTAAAMLAALLVVAVLDSLRLDHRRLRLRVWWSRRRLLVIVGVLVALAASLLLTTAFFHRPLGAAVEYSCAAAFAPPSIALPRALQRLLPPLLFYEFAIVVLAIVGAFAIASRRVGDRFARWSALWALASLAIFAALGANRADAVVALVLPLALLAAYALDWMHQSVRWNSIRYAIVAALALTLYLQCLTSFIFPAPDVSEAPWRRHALLFWTDPATSIQTPRECARMRATLPPTATTSIPDDAPQVQWYLRDLTAAAAPADASLVVTIGKTQSGAVAGDPNSSHFGFELWWTPNFHALTVARAIEYFFTQRAWSDVEIRDLDLAAKPDQPVPKP